MKLADQLCSEANIEQTITQWLALDGWIGLKTTPVSNRARGAGFGGLGMADYQYRRYLYGPGGAVDGVCQCGMREGCACCEILWIEFKKLGGKAAAHQRDWIELERERGALVLLVGEDCPATIQGIQDWYRISGLMRKQL